MLQSLVNMRQREQAIARRSKVEQSTNAVLMIRPARFYPNPETAADNAFQREPPGDEAVPLTERARVEFDHAIETLRAHGVTVHVVDDTVTPEKPDAVFPNNWISTHHDGRIALYPMFSPARRRERRIDIIDELRRHYRVGAVIDYSACESDGQCLEGTGSLVLDYVHRLAYVSLSKRAHPEPLRKFCAEFAFEPVTFTSVDPAGQLIYHTNVMMCVGTDFALVGLRSIPDGEERRRIRERLEKSGKQIVELAPEQIANFAGNAIELQSDREKLLVLSARGLAALSLEQVSALERHARIVPLTLPTIELAGGSARCMIATIHLPSL
jgi:hypothetical protein